MSHVNGLTPISNHDISIQSLNIQVARVPLSGMSIFDLNLGAGVAVERSIEKIRQEITVLAAEINLDLTFQK